MVRAQGIAAQKAGAHVVDATVQSVRDTGDGVTLVTDQGDLRAERVLVAAGGFTNMLLEHALPLTVYARTVALFEIDKDQAARLRGQPSMIYLKPNGEDPYMLPAIGYPDGKTYLKLGGDPVDVALRNAQETSEWFRTGGNMDVARSLEADMRARMPDLQIRSVKSDACATTFTSNHRPIIDLISDRVAVAVGGCGRAAKNADELGRMGGEALFGRLNADCSLKAAGG